MFVSLTEVSLVGEKNQIATPKISLDSHIYFGALPSSSLAETGTSIQPIGILPDRDNGSNLEVSRLSVVVPIHGRRVHEMTLAIPLDGVGFVVGAKFLDDMGLRIFHETGKIELEKNQVLLSNLWFR